MNGHEESRSRSSIRELVAVLGVVTGRAHGTRNIARDPSRARIVGVQTAGAVAALTTDASIVLELRQRRSTRLREACDMTTDALQIELARPCDERLVRAPVRRRDPPAIRGRMTRAAAVRPDIA